MPPGLELNNKKKAEDSNDDLLYTSGPIASSGSENFACPKIFHSAYHRLADLWKQEKKYQEEWEKLEKAFDTLKPSENDPNYKKFNCILEFLNLFSCNPCLDDNNQSDLYRLFKEWINYYFSASEDNKFIHLLFKDIQLDGRYIDNFLLVISLINKQIQEDTLLNKSLNDMTFLRSFSHSINVDLSKILNDILKHYHLHFNTRILIFQVLLQDIKKFEDIKNRLELEKLKKLENDIKVLMEKHKTIHRTMDTSLSADDITKLFQELNELGCAPKNKKLRDFKSQYERYTLLQSNIKDKLIYFLDQAIKMHKSIKKDNNFVRNDKEWEKHWKEMKKKFIASTNNFIKFKPTSMPNLQNNIDNLTKVLSVSLPNLHKKDPFNANAVHLKEKSKNTALTNLDSSSSSESDFSHKIFESSSFRSSHESIDKKFVLGKNKEKGELSSNKISEDNMMNVDEQNNIANNSEFSPENLKEKGNPKDESNSFAQNASDQSDTSSEFSENNPVDTESSKHILSQDSEKNSDLNSKSISIQDRIASIQKLVYDGVKLITSSMQKPISEADKSGNHELLRRYNKLNKYLYELTSLMGDLERPSDLDSWRISINIVYYNAPDIIDKTTDYLDKLVNIRAITVQDNYENNSNRCDGRMKLIKAKKLTKELIENLPRDVEKIYYKRKYHKIKEKLKESRERAVVSKKKTKETLKGFQKSLVVSSELVLGYLFSVGILLGFTVVSAITALGMLSISPLVFPIFSFVVGFSALTAFFYHTIRKNKIIGNNLEELKNPINQHSILYSEESVISSREKHEVGYKDEEAHSNRLTRSCSLNELKNTTNQNSIFCPEVSNTTFFGKNIVAKTTGIKAVGYKDEEAHSRLSKFSSGTLRRSSL